MDCFTNNKLLYEIPFLDRMGFVFAICVIVMYVITMFENKRGVKTSGLEVDRTMFKMIGLGITFANLS